MLLGMYKLLEANKKEINVRNGTTTIYRPQTHTSRSRTGYTVCCLLHRQGGREWDMNMYEKHIR